MHPSRTRLALVLLALFGLMAAPAPAAAQSEPQVVPGEEHCVVNVRSDDRLNVRARPGAGARIVTRLAYGDCGIIVVAPCRNGWCRIEDGHFEGYVNARFISMVSPALYCVTGVARNDRLNLRAYPAAISRIVTRLRPNQCDIAFLPYRVGNWQKVRVGGYEGWVNSRYLSGE